MKLPHTEVKFYPEVKSQTGLSSLQVSYKRALRERSGLCSLLTRRKFQLLKKGLHYFQKNTVTEKHFGKKQNQTILYI